MSLGTNYSRNTSKIENWFMMFKMHYIGDNAIKAGHYILLIKNSNYSEKTKNHYLNLCKDFTYNQIGETNERN